MELTFKEGQAVQPIYQGDRPGKVLISRPAEVILEDGRRYHPTKLRAR